MCHGRLLNGEDFDMFSWTLTVWRWMGGGGCLHIKGMGMQIDARAHACELADLNKRAFAHTPIYTLYLSACFTTSLRLAAVVVVVGGGLCCAKAEKMSGGGRREGEKEKGRMRRLPDDNEIKPISVEWNNREEEVTAGLQHTQLYCL